MLTQVFIVLLSFALHAISIPCAPQAILATDDPCPKNVHIVGVRATLEQQGFGVMGPLVERLKNGINGSDAYAIVYPATGLVKNFPWVQFPDVYKKSEQAGVDNLTAHIQEFSTTCPDTPIVLLGYSQGAHVVGDTFCGRLGKALFPFQPSLDPKYTSSVRAVIQFGDPSNRRPADLPWHVGTATRAGIFERASIANCTYLGSYWQSYCDRGDPFCAAPANNLTVHLRYNETYFDAAYNFVLGKLNAPELNGLSKEGLADSYEL